MARGEFLAVRAQQPYDQGVAEAKVAALALLGKETPPYVSVPTLGEEDRTSERAEQVTKEDPPASLIKLCDGKCF